MPFIDEDIMELWVQRACNNDKHAIQRMLKMIRHLKGIKEVAENIDIKGRFINQKSVDELRDMDTMELLDLGKNVVREFGRRWKTVPTEPLTRHNVLQEMELELRMANKERYRAPVLRDPVTLEDYDPDRPSRPTRAQIKAAKRERRKNAGRKPKEPEFSFED